MVGLLIALTPLLLHGLPGPATLASAHWMLLWGVAVVTPMAARLSQLDRRLQRLLPLPALAMAAGWLWQGNWLIVGAASWLLTTLALAGWALTRLKGRPIGETTRLLGFLYSPVGGIWTLAYAWQRGLMGFDPTMTLLTGVHFCYVTLGAMQWAGLAATHLESSPTYRRLARLLWVSPALVALGITWSHLAGQPTWLEIMAVGAQVLATAGISLLWLVRGPLQPRLTLSALCSLVTMGLALNYAGGRFWNLVHLDLAWMIPYHGLVNALGFVSLGLWGWAHEWPEGNIPDTKLSDPIP